MLLTSTKTIKKTILKLKVKQYSSAKKIQNVWLSIAVNSCELKCRLRLLKNILMYYIENLSLMQTEQKKLAHKFELL